MKWFEGSIADAVSLSKSTNAIFVVYVEGTDEMSKSMSSALDSSGITNNLISSQFVCIKLTKDSQSHRQFTEIYKIVPVPSLFFIGENGIPLEIIAGDNVKENVQKKISEAIAEFRGKHDPEESSVGSTSSRENPQTNTLSGSLQKEGETFKPVSTPSQPVQETTLSASAAPGEAVEPSVPAADDKNKTAEMERVQELIKKKRVENQHLEDEKEKERELARRQMGKEISQARKTQQDRELEELRKEREKEKKLEAEARQRVLRQIEEDKANRAARNQILKSTGTSAATSPTSSTPPQTQTAAKPVHSNQSNEARIQFKLPNGQTRTQAFPSTTTLRDLRAFIDKNIEIPFKEYTLATTFPRREFVNRDLDRDLTELELFPSSVLLILPVQGNMPVMRGPGWTSTLSAMIWALIQPVLDIGSYIKSLITGTRRDEGASSEATSTDQEPSTSQQPEQEPQPHRQPYYNSLGGGKSVRRRGNVHTLSDGNDSNDENNTWNGNSTQLM